MTTQPDEFDTAVLYSYDPNVTGEVKNKAVQYCQQVKTAPDGWKFCLDKFFKSSIGQVKFFSLVVIQEVIQHRYLALNEQERELLKTSLVKWLTQYLPNAPNEDIFIKNKFAQIFVLLFKMEYPQHWPTFFNDLLSCLQLGPALVIMFVRILNTIDEEVVNKEVPRNTQEVARSTEIKDAMRQDCIPNLTSTWFTILNTYQDNTDMCKECLECIRRYINWIDITLIANEKYVPLFFKFLASPQEVLREKAVDCIHEIVVKGMPDPLAKLSLLSNLRLYSVLSTISDFGEGELLEKIAKLVNALGNVILDLREPIQNLINQQKAGVDAMATLQTMLDETILLLFKFLNDEHDDVSATTFKFAAGYLNTLKAQQGQLTPRQVENLNVFLQIIRNKLKYELDFDFDNTDEEEQEFIEYRKELATIYKTVTMLSPQLVAQFVHATLQAVTANITAASFADVEVALTLFFILGEIESTTKQLEAFFAETITLIAQGPLSTYPHQSVALVYYDTLVRYEKYLPENPDVLRSILIAFLDNRGIRNSNATIRSRTCYLFQRFVKNKNVAPFLESILQSLKDFLTVNYDLQKLISFDDQQHLYDSLGHIVGQQLPDKSLAATYLDANITPLTKQLLDIIDKKLYKTDTPDRPIYAATILQIISCVGSYSKGFNGQKEFAPFFRQTLEVVMKVLQELPQHEEIRAKSIFYVHRMIECLGVEVLLYLPPLISQLMITSGPKDFVEFTRLLNQLMSKFKEQMIPVIDALLIQILARLSKFMSELSQINAPSDSKNATLTEPEREILDLKKAYYVFLSHVVSHNCATCLISQTNLPHLNGVFETILQGCNELNDINATKQCYLILKRLVEQWCGQTSIQQQQPTPNGAIPHPQGQNTPITPTSSLPSSLLPSFNKWVLEHVTGVLFTSPCTAPKFDLSDAGIYQILSEIVAIQKILVIKLGKEYSNYVKTVVLPSLQCPPNVAEEFVFHMESTPVNEFKKLFANFITHYKKSVTT